MSSDEDFKSKNDIVKKALENGWTVRQIDEKKIELIKNRDGIEGEKRGKLTMGELRKEILG